MSTEREKLFESLFEIAENYNIPLTNNPDMHRELPSAGDFCGDVESAVLAAGYRKPRTVTTVEELDALPVGSVVLSLAYHSDVNGMAIVFQRWHDGLWHRGARSGDTHPDNFLPATVLHEGNADV